MNKKTGEIGLLCYTTSDGSLIIQDINTKNNYEYIAKYDSLAELNAEWEDYEEPKDVWWLDNEGNVNHASRIDDYCFKKNKQIGNYFETKEEAEKAVKKLNAWKRLKDKGFKFDLWDYDGSNYQERIRTGRILFRVKDYEENDKDLDLLFGGEE